MSHHSHAQHFNGNIESDERAVTKWLNTMEGSLANPARQFSMADFSPQEIRAVNNYIKTHENSLGRYAQFLPNVQVEDPRRQRR